MKNFVVLAMMIFPLFGLAHENHGPSADLIKKSSIALATVTSLELFEDNALGSLWSVSSAMTVDEVTSNILYTDSSSRVRNAGYDCHLHTHGSDVEVHCHSSADEVSELSAPTSLTYTADHFISGLSNALDILDRKVTPVQNVVAMKAWQANDQMYFTLNYTASGGVGAAHFMCHFHSADEIDCHRSLNPGPQEPAF